MASRRISLAGALLSAVLLAFASAAPAGEPPSGGPTLAGLARIMEGGPKQQALAMLGAALAHDDPKLRAMAARVIHVMDLHEMEEGVGAAFASERDEDAAREEVRALAALREDPSWESLADRAAEVDGSLRRTVLMLAMRRDGVRALPLFHRREGDLSPETCEAMLRLATAQDPSAVEASAGESLAAGAPCGWRAGLAILRDGKRLPAEALVVRGLTHASLEIREATLAELARLTAVDHDVLTPPLMAALESEASGEEGFLRELVGRMAGRKPRTNEAWVSLLKETKKGELLLDSFQLRQAVQSSFHGEERTAAGARWVNEAIEPKGSSFWPLWHANRKRTLADLPAGLAQAVFQEWGCRMPQPAQLIAAKMTFDPMGRPARIEMMDAEAGKGCRRAAALLLRAGLPPEYVVIRPDESHTLYVPLGKDQDARFDDLGPWVPSSAPDDDEVTPPARTVFVPPHYPESMIKSRAVAKVILEIVVDEHGVPGNILIVKSGEESFDQSAVLAVSQWRYKPAGVGGRAVPAYLTVIVDYDLRRK